MAHFPVATATNTTSVVAAAAAPAKIEDKSWLEESDKDTGLGL